MAGVQVALDHLAEAGDVPARHRIGELDVLAVQGGQVRGGGEDCQMREAEQSRSERAQHLLDHAVAIVGGEGEVEGVVVDGEVRGTIGRGLLRREHRRERLDEGGPTGLVGGDAGDGVPLEHRADREQLLPLPGGRGRDLGALLRQEAHQPPGFQLQHRLARRGAARAVLLGDVDLTQQGARLDIAGGDLSGRPRGDLRRDRTVLAVIEPGEGGGTHGGDPNACINGCKTGPGCGAPPRGRAGP